MTPKELAEKMNGVEYGDEEDYAEIAKENRLVILHGYSDDLIENLAIAVCYVNSVGYVREEAYVGETDIVFLDKIGFLDQTIEIDMTVATAFSHFENLKKKYDDAIKVSVKWRQRGCKYSCNVYLESSLDHAYFNVLEDGEKFCRAVVVKVPDSW